MYLLVQNLPKDSHVVVFDHDTVGMHNVGNQFFELPDVGSYKVSAIHNRLRSAGLLDDVEFDGVCLQFNEYNRVNPIVICASDNMLSRKRAYTQWCASEDRMLFIDMRSAAQVFQMYVLTEPSTQYEATLFDDSEVSEGDCAFRQTPQTSMLSAGICVQAICNFLSNQPVPYLTRWYGMGIILINENQPATIESASDTVAEARDVPESDSSEGFALTDDPSSDIDLHDEGVVRVDEVGESAV